MTPDSTIYERLRARARKNNGPGILLPRICGGMALGGAIWMCLALLGVPNVVHVPTLMGLVPFAAAGSAIAVTRFRRVLAYVSALLLIALAVIAYTPLVVAPARALIRSDPLPDSADAVVVLSAGVTADGFLHEQGLDRLLKGLALVRNGVAPTLLVTREKRNVGKRQITASHDQDSLAALVGVTSVLSTPLESSTRDEAVGVERIARKAGWTRIVVVTSPFHTRRACATFEKAGLTVSCVPSDSRDIAARSLELPDDRIGAFGMWIYEMAATLQYRRRGWL